MRSLSAGLLPCLLTISLCSRFVSAQVAAAAQQGDSSATSPDTSTVQSGAGGLHAPIAKVVPRGSVAGRVFLADSHAPARGARIMLISTSELGLDDPKPAGQGDAPAAKVEGPPQMATTSLDGTFLVSHVAPGQYVVLAFAAGYLSPLDGIDVRVDKSDEDMKAAAKKILSLAPLAEVRGAETLRVDVELRRGAVLAGKVEYSDGSPASQLAVALQHIGDSQPSQGDTADAGMLMRGIFLQQRYMTDDQGRFRIAGIAPGEYRLAVVQDFGTTEDLGNIFSDGFDPAATQGKLVVYSGNTLHRKDAKTYKLAAGDEVNEIQIILPLNGLHTIHGIASGKEGAPLNDGRVDLTDAVDPSISFHAAIEPDGQFRFVGIPEGSYQLKASGGVFEDTQSSTKFAPDAPAVMTPEHKLVRNFADTTIPVVVSTADLDNLIVSLADAPVPAESQGAPQAPPTAPSGDVQTR